MMLQPSMRARRHQQGSAVLVLLSLLTIMAIFAASNQMTLRRLHRELQLIETRQQKKYPLPLPHPQASTVATNLTNINLKSVIKM